jgi:hypothetical protein
MDGVPAKYQSWSEFSGRSRATVGDEKGADDLPLWSWAWRFRTAGDFYNSGSRGDVEVIHFPF